MTNLQLFDFEGYEVRVVGTSENPEWVFSEVLPSIRSSGRYELPSEAMRRNRVVKELIKLKQNHQRNLKLVNICNDLIDFTPIPSSNSKISSLNES